MICLKVPSLTETGYHSGDTTNAWLRTTRTYFQFPHFLQGRWSPQQVEPCALAWRKSEGRELFDESLTVVGSERQQGELRRLICKNRIMLVHRIKRWAPCFLSAVTEGLHQEVAGVSQATVSTPFSPSSLSTVAAYADRTQRSDPLLCLMQKLQRRPQLPNALETSLTSQREARKEMFKVGLKCRRYQPRTNVFQMWK